MMIKITINGIELSVAGAHAALTVNTKLRIIGKKRIFLLHLIAREASFIARFFNAILIGKLPERTLARFAA